MLHASLGRNATTGEGSVLLNAKYISLPKLTFRVVMKWYRGTWYIGSEALPSDYRFRPDCDIAVHRTTSSERRGGSHRHLCRDETSRHCAARAPATRTDSFKRAPTHGVRLPFIIRDGLNTAGQHRWT